MKRSIAVISLLMMIALLFASCADASGDMTVTDGERGTDGSFEMRELVGEPSDYSDADNWLNIPEIKYDVDTVYVYPTVYSDSGADAPAIVPIDNEAMRAGAQSNFAVYSPAYSHCTNVFAPYYRQTNMYTYAGLGSDEILEFQHREQRTDIYAALDYYFEHYNEGRPYILAGHSQGSMMIRVVLREYMQAHPEHYGNMAAAYVLGYSMTTDDLEYNPELRFAQGADDTGVVISWNIEGPGNNDQSNIVVCENAVSINPINWRTDETYAPAEDNLGTYTVSSVTGELEEYPVKADAQVDTQRGVVICTTDGLPSISDRSAASAYYFGPESYHNGDYLFYFDNIKENVKLRSERFLAERRQSNK